ncbi:MAG: ergothioneine biosynthesis protein EgtB [Pseudomonadales bacterium]
MQQHPGRSGTIPADRYASIRQATEKLCAGLATEDYGVQPMDDASPPKWHLAHTTWFFETFLLKPYLPGYRAVDGHYEYLFNSYYNSVGQPFPRARRGTLSRPTVAEIYDYRRRVDEAMARLLGAELGADILQRVELGLQHEQQHQELILTDVKFAFGHNPLYPAYRDRGPAPPTTAPPAGDLGFVRYAGGRVAVGADPAAGGFCFDNEAPRHEVLLAPFALGDRLVSNAEFQEFVADGGYQQPALWLSEAWTRLGAGTLAQAPLYWRCRDGAWYEYRLDGLQPLDPGAPVSHVSFFEADAYARWRGCRLPTEQEWEHAASATTVTGNFADAGVLHPLAAVATGPAPRQLFGDLWEWTASPYVAYPGYRPLPGALGEYNGKFMSSQMVLRGGSCATPAGHVRASYRNFFYPPDKWQFSGIRLARDE